MVSGYSLSPFMTPQRFESRAQRNETEKAYWYAPELFCSNPIYATGSTIYTDIYSLACVMLEVRLTMYFSKETCLYFDIQTFTLKRPFYDIEYYEALFHTVVTQRKCPARPTHSDLPDFLWHIMVDCWQFEPTDRPSISEVLERVEKDKPSVPFSLPEEMRRLMCATAEEKFDR